MPEDERQLLRMRHERGAQRGGHEAHAGTRTSREGPVSLMAGSRSEEGARSREWWSGKEGCERRAVWAQGWRVPTCRRRGSAACGRQPAPREAHQRQRPGGKATAGQSHARSLAALRLAAAAPNRPKRSALEPRRRRRAAPLLSPSSYHHGTPLPPHARSDSAQHAAPR
jgi:hypothetical protein